MSQQEFVLILFQVVVLVLAFSVHESAHAYVAMRLGDPTAYMLGRVTLNPMKHLDPLGSVLVPLISLVYGGMLIGWAKPCPVTTRNFRHIKRDDILVSMAGPASNLAMATVALILLVIFKHLVAGGVPSIEAAMLMARHVAVETDNLPTLFPIATAAVLRCLHQPAAVRVQPDPNPAAGWQPCIAPVSSLPGGAGVQPDWHVGADYHLSVRRRLDLRHVLYPLLNVYNGLLGSL